MKPFALSLSKGPGRASPHTAHTRLTRPPHNQPCAMLRTRPAVPPQPNKRRKCIQMRPPHPLLGVLALALVLPLLLLACDATTESKDGPSTDREALVALYNATDGPNWHSRDNWLSDMPIDDWHGVTTDPSGRVTELTLPPSYELLVSRYGLADGEVPPGLADGEIPPELANLANLQSLSLSRNQLSGEIPQELANLINLQALILSDNQLSGEISPELGNLAYLRSLGLRNNQLSGCFPSSLSDNWNFHGLPFCP